MKKILFLAPLLTFLLALSGCSSDATPPVVSAPSTAETAPITTKSSETPIDKTMDDQPEVTSPVTTPEASAPQPKKPAIPPPNKNTVTVTTISIKDLAFNPADATIKAGDTVKWTNLDSMEHRITSTGKFDSGTLKTGGSFSHIFKTVGTYDYGCSIHPSMKGKIMVVQ